MLSSSSCPIIRNFRYFSITIKFPIQFFVVLLTDTVLKLLQLRNAVRTPQILMDVLKIKYFSHSNTDTLVRNY